MTCSNVCFRLKDDFPKKEEENSQSDHKFLNCTIVALYFDYFLGWLVELISCCFTRVSYIGKDIKKI